MSATNRWDDHAQILERILIEADLRLLSPAHMGNGDVDELLDAPIARDTVSGKPLLSGASLAGALRAALARSNADAAKAAKALFGETNNDATVDSALYVYDAIGDSAATELRDGVKLDSKTRTAANKTKFDLELAQTGTLFKLRFELAVSDQDQCDLRLALAETLTALERSEIELGKRKTRGFGKCVAENWRVRRCDMRTPQGILNWLNDTASQATPGNIASALGFEALPVKADLHATLIAVFALDGSLLIRSESGDANAPDMQHLHSPSQNGYRPILSGSSLAGALRARANRIFNTLHPQLKQENNENSEPEFVNQLFGASKPPLKISRLRVAETVIEHADTGRVQNRVSIDRFTGGARNSALFSQMPAWGTAETQIKIILTISQPTDADIGLLLLLLRDLWLGDLALGGEQSVGRGRLRGLNATLNYADKTYHLQQEAERLVVSDAPALQAFADAFNAAKI